MVSEALRDNKKKPRQAMGALERLLAFPTAIARYVSSCGQQQPLRDSFQDLSALETATKAENLPLMSVMKVPLMSAKSSARPPPLLVALEGNIGAGKSTTIKLCELELRRRGVDAAGVPEPVDEWCRPRDDMGGVSPLQSFYADPSGTALSFQIMILASRIKQTLRAVEEGNRDVILIERDPLDRKIFPEHARRSGLFSALDAYAYELMRSVLYDSFPSVRPSATVYMRTQAEVCKERVRTRMRKGEIAQKDEGQDVDGGSSSIDIRIDELEQLHDEVFLGWQPGGHPLLAICDGNTEAICDFVCGLLRRVNVKT